MLSLVTSRFKLTEKNGIKKQKVHSGHFENKSQNLRLDSHTSTYTQQQVTKSYHLYSNSLKGLKLNDDIKTSVHSAYS